MSAPEAQERTVPTVPEGTPGRDWRAALPAPLPPGAQQPWRRLGPGNRAWVVIVTAVAAVAMAVAGILTVGIGFASTAFDKQGRVVLSPMEYQATESGCTGVEDAAGVRKGAKISFRAKDHEFSSALGAGRLRSGRCVFGFDLSALDARPAATYSVTIGDVPGTPVGGDELADSSGDVSVYVAPR